MIYTAVGRRAGLPLAGVGFPGHFLVAYEGEPRLLVDPFRGGRLLSVDDCQRLLREVLGAAARLESTHLAASSPRQILERVVTNLRVAYERAGDMVRATRAAEQLAVVRRAGELHARRN